MKVIIDSSSIINFLKYYYFDKKEENAVNQKLYDFILDKIYKHEIFIIDKVFNELNRPETINVKQLTKKNVIDSVYLFPKVEQLIDTFYIKSNERFLGNDSLLIEHEIQRYQEKYADLYLIALCQDLILKGDDVILISEETFSRDNKLIKKIPTICHHENINCKDLPFLLFSHYQNNLIFDLEIKN
jgi:Domain of unknown function (DUF4411)